MSERLTKRLANGGVMFYKGDYWNVCYPWKEDCLRDIDRMAIKLCELEDKIETGNLCEVRHGEWKYNEGGGYVCSECNCWLEDYYGATPEMMNYCFKCGAKMDGERREGCDKQNT